MIPDLAPGGYERLALLARRERRETSRRSRRMANGVLRSEATKELSTNTIVTRWWE